MGKVIKPYHYVPAVATDIRKTFEKIRKGQKDKKAVAPPPPNFFPLFEAAHHLILNAKKGRDSAQAGGFHYKVPLGDMDALKEAYEAIAAIIAPEPPQELAPLQEEPESKTVAKT